MEQTDNLTSDSTVLVVDDSMANLQLIGSVLIENGLKPSFSTNGANALLFLEHNIPDLVLLDIAMPGMDGFEICKRIKTDPRMESIPIIFLTARTQTDELVKGFDLGAVDYVTKPFNKTELVKRIKTHIGLKNAVQTIKEQNHELARLNEAKDKIFSVIAHDLRGPVANFKEISEMLLDTNSSTHSTELLMMLKNSATNTYILLENLLNWSLSQRDKLPVKMQVLRVYGMLTQVLSLYSPAAKIKGLQMSVDGDRALEAWADYDMVYTTLRNLVGNAVKYTDAGGNIELKVTVFGDMVLVAVKDTGVGLTGEEIDKILNPMEFYRSVYGGSGLGTKLCLEFVKKNGGRMWIESVPGKGSTFFFTLPKHH